MIIETHSEIGLSNENQDEFIVIRNKDSLCMAICDGHGKYGKLAAERVKKGIKSGGAILGENDKYNDFFVERMAKYLKKLGGSFCDSGVSLSCFYKIKNSFYLIQIGDCSAFLKTESSFLFFPGHRVDNPQNAQDLRRSFACGGILKIFNNSAYLSDKKQKTFLRVTKCFGNSSLKKIIDRNPDVHFIKENIRSVVIGSSGFDAEVGEIAALTKDKCDLNKFVQNQKIRGIKENFTICIAYF